MQPHYNNTAITEDDYAQLSEEFMIPLPMVIEVVDAFKKGKKSPTHSGAIGDRVKAFFKALSSDMDTSDQEDTQEAPAPSPASPSRIAEELATDSDEDSEPAKLTERDGVVEYASNQLMKAMTSDDGHFLITDEGFCSINEQNPPSIEKSYQVVSNVLKLRELTDRMEDKGCWMLGSIISSLEDYHGEAFSVNQIADASTASYNTIATTLSVYKAFKDKKYNLSFTHHKEAHYADIEKEDKKLVLYKCEKYNLNSKHLRTLCSIIKKMEDSQIVKNIRNHDSAIALIEAFTAAKAIYYIYLEGQWSWKNGLDGEIPEGSVVIDCKNKKSYANGHFMGEITKDAKK